MHALLPSGVEARPALSRLIPGSQTETDPLKRESHMRAAYEKDRAEVLRGCCVSLRETLCPATIEATVDETIHDGHVARDVKHILGQLKELCTQVEPGRTDRSRRVSENRALYSRSRARFFSTMLPLSTRGITMAKPYS